METGEWLSVAINLAVGGYFAFGFHHHLRHALRGRPALRLFALAVPLVRGLGLLVIAGTAAYILARVAGLVAPQSL